MHSTRSNRTSGHQLVLTLCCVVVCAVDVRLVQAPKPASAVAQYNAKHGVSVEVGATGNWQCKLCSNENWPHRLHCNRCQAPKLPTVGASSSDGGPVAGFTHGHAAIDAGDDDNASAASPAVGEGSAAPPAERTVVRIEGAEAAGGGATAAATSKVTASADSENSGDDSASTSAAEPAAAAAAVPGASANGEAAPVGVVGDETQKEAKELPPAMSEDQSVTTTAATTANVDGDGAAVVDVAAAPDQQQKPAAEDVTAAEAAAAIPSDGSSAVAELAAVGTLGTSPVSVVAGGTGAQAVVGPGAGSLPIGQEKGYAGHPGTSVSHFAYVRVCCVVLRNHLDGGRPQTKF